MLPFLLLAVTVFLYSQSRRTGTITSLLGGKITELLKCFHSLLRGENELSTGYHSREAGLLQSFSDLSRTSHNCYVSWSSVDPLGTALVFFLRWYLLVMILLTLNLSDI